MGPGTEVFNFVGNTLREYRNAFVRDNTSSRFTSPDSHGQSREHYRRRSFMEAQNGINWPDESIHDSQAKHGIEKKCF